MRLDLITSHNTARQYNAWLCSCNYRDPFRIRPSEATLLDNQNPKYAGFEEASRKGDELLMVARALASDRMLLVIPAWAYLACLVVAAALTRVSESGCQVVAFA